VEVGADQTIDRESVQDTIVGAGTPIDKLVQIGYNVRLGRCRVIGAQVGVISEVPAGSVLLGGPAQPRNDFF
jgi:UDP-3-O-[3-hydroxymyristoyl] glucosamine N-acyltransferase